MQFKICIQKENPTGKRSWKKSKQIFDIRHHQIYDIAKVKRHGNILDISLNSKPISLHIGMIQILFSELPIVEVVVKNVCWGLVGCACLATIILW